MLILIPAFWRPTCSPIFPIPAVMSVTQSINQQKHLLGYSMNRVAQCGDLLPSEATLYVYIKACN